MSAPHIGITLWLSHRNKKRGTSGIKAEQWSIGKQSALPMSVLCQGVLLRTIRFCLAVFDLTVEEANAELDAVREWLTELVAYDTTRGEIDANAR